MPPDLAAAATGLVDAAAVAIPAWLHRVLAGLVPGTPVAEVTAVVDAVATDVLDRLRAVLGADVDDQRTTPLAVLRGATTPLTAWLRDRGVPVPDGRDPYDADAFPDDAYGLVPASWADVDPALTAPAIAWGVAKAAEHKRRHGGGAPVRDTGDVGDGAQVPAVSSGSDAPAPAAEVRHRTRTVGRPGTDESAASGPGVVVAYVPDLMDRSRVASSAPRTRFVSAPGDLAAAATGPSSARLVVVDLSRAGVLDAIAAVRAAAPSVPVVGFGSHVDTEVLAAAEAAGARALPRSRFFARLGELLAGLG